MKNIVRMSASENANKATVFGMAVRQFLLNEQAKGRDISQHLQKMTRVGFTPAQVKSIIS